MSLRMSLLAAIAALGLLAGTAAADEPGAVRRALHAPSGHARARAVTVPSRAAYRPVARPVARVTYRAQVRPTVYRGSRHVETHRAPPVHVHSSHCGYVAGHYEIRIREVVIPGHYVEHEVPARFEVRWDHHCRSFVSVRVESRRIVREWVPRRITEKREKVWVPASWSCGC